LLVALCSTISFLTTRNRAEKMKLELKTKCWSMIVVLREFKVYIYELLILKGQSNCWGYPKFRLRSPNTKERNTKTFKYTDDASGDKESPKDRSSLKSCVSFYTCPRAPFIRRRMDFYILKVPSNPRNIPNVNTYMNSFTSNTFRSLPLVHTSNPDF
jgi:hypothetical protein